MRIEFRGQFALPMSEVFGYYPTPADWVRLYGFGGAARALGDGWHVVPLKHFPFPLVTRVMACRENEFVCWTFKGFWRGYAEMRFASHDGKVVVTGYEQIAVRWLFGLSPFVERWFLERTFRALWARGWRRLREIEASRPRVPTAEQPALRGACIPQHADSD